MNMYKKILALLLLSCLSVYAQTAGNSGLSFLKLGFGARNIAMGDAGSVSASDVTAAFYNPARLALNPASEIMLMHNEWIEGIRSELLGARTKFLGLQWALGFNVTTISDIEVRTIPGAPLTTFSANYFFGSLSTGFNIASGISAGATIKYLYEGIYIDESTGLGFDFGLNYKSTIEGLSFSAIIKNIGSMNALQVEETKLPTEFRAGGAYSFNIEQPELAITGAAEVQKYTATNDIHFNLGAEVVYDNLISLRAGYMSGYISKNVTAGVGLRWGNLNFDYALSPFTYDLGMGHTVSLGFSF